MLTSRELILAPPILAPPILAPPILFPPPFLTFLLPSPSGSAKGPAVRPEQSLVTADAVQRTLAPV